MSSVITAHHLGKRYGRKWALSDCNLEVPGGCITALVGPNGAGKTTLLHMSVGLLRPTAGTLSVLGGPVAGHREAMARVGFVAQETPLYPRLTVADHLRLGARLNPGWDPQLANDRVAEIGLEPSQKAGRLSGGQRAQLALTLAVAKRPDLLVLDEPLANLDPLARREFLQSLMAFVADRSLSVVLSSHLISDLERVCEYLVLLIDSSVRIAGDVDELLGSHRRLIGSRRDPDRLPETYQVIEASHTDRQSTLLVRLEEPIRDPAWTVQEVGLEDLVLAYMGYQARSDQKTLSPVRS